MSRWLAGDLPPEEVACFEAEMEAAAEEGEDKLPEALRAGILSRGAEKDEIGALIAAIKSGPETGPRDSDQWRAVLDPCDEPGALGPYEVRALIAQGGMGVILEGHDPVLERRVAIKVLSPDLAGNSVARQRFLREARAAAALEHDHILPVYSVHDGALPWFAMRLAEGGTLQQLLDAEGALALPRLKSLALQIASALRAAHAAGLIHRDIKPANILLDAARERAWLADFGIARAIEDPSLTYRGFITGTPSYMSPEQAAGTLVDARSDLFSLGAVLYHCATGRVPFSGETSVSVLKNVVAASPQSPSNLRPGLPSWFLRLLDKLMAREPDERFGSAAEVITVLEQEAAPLSARARRRRLALAAAAAVALLLFTAARWSVTANLLNRMLISPERAFVVEGTLGAHATLADAVQAAESGAVISIHGEGPWTLRGLSIPESSTLTIRAAENARPRFLIENTDAPGITSRGQLTMERLTFTRDTEGRDTHSMIEAAAGSLTLRRCDLRATSPARRDAAVPCAVTVNESAALHLDHSAIICTWVAPVGIRTTAAARPSLQMNGSALIGMPVLWMRCAAGTVVKLTASCCSIPSPILFGDAPDSPLPVVEASVTNCLLRAETAVWWTPGEPASAIAAQLRWQGSQNVFAANAIFLTSATRGAIREATPLMRDLSAWQASTGVSESGATLSDLTPASREDGQRPASTLTREELEALAAPWRAAFPDTGADFRKLWP